jgi:hypothetical protein
MGEGGKMNEKPDGGPAFPADIQRRDPVTTEWDELPPQGMTLRDYFAGQAMTAIDIDALVREAGMGADAAVSHRARLCYAFADAMIAARAK